MVEAVTKIVAMGGNYENIRLSLQEYFEDWKNRKDGKTVAALLGTLCTSTQIRNWRKGHMSGTHDLHVPPTLVALQSM